MISVEIFGVIGLRLGDAGRLLRLRGVLRLRRLWLAMLLRLTRADYDACFPIEITPEPTEMARVGIVWTEIP